MMMASSNTTQNNSTSDDFDDPIRTEEYKRAFAEFWARRSTTTFENREKQPAKISDVPKQNSEKKNKRFSLPNHAEFITSAAPQIQIQLNNQFELRTGSRRVKNRNVSLTSTSPDLLPPRFIRNRHVDFDECDNPPSPPEEFFKDSSLPYYDKESSVFDGEIIGGRTPRSHIVANKNKRNKKRPSPPSNTKNDSNNSVGGNVSFNHSENSNNWKCFDDTDTTTDARFGSAVRKLEQMCQVVKIPNCAHFRGVPLFQNKSPDFKQSDSGNDMKIVWNRVTWNDIPVCVKIFPKRTLFADDDNKKDVSINRHIFTDIDILTKIRHSNILLLMGMYCEGSVNVSTIFEDNIGSLYENIHENGNKLSSGTIVSYLAGIASALVYLTSNKFIHTSVSSHNILLTSTNIAKLCGFELCTKIIESEKIYQNNNSNNIYNKINTSSENDYENITELNVTNETENSAETCYECLPQNKSIREFFTYYRWQAPELFDEINGLVYPCVKSDVYSLSLVLWECFNNSIPWKTLTYEKLLELYLTWGRGVNLHNKVMYPQVVYDILSEGLSVKSEKRCTIQILYRRFSEAMEFFNNTERMCDVLIERKDVSIDCNQIPEQIEAFPITMKLSEIKKYPVTNLDESNHSNELSSYQSNCKTPFEQKESSERLSSLGLSSKESLANTEIFLIEESYINSLQNTDSTEYCSLLTPDRRYFNKTHTPDSACNKCSPEKDTSLTDKILKLNTSLTPKSYKPLQIEPPSPDTIDNLKTFADSFELKNNINKSTYSFDIEDTSLPITPIARSNKIKKNAWLSGKNTNYTDSDDKSTVKTTHPVVCSKSYSNIDTQTEFLSLQTDSVQKQLSTSYRCIGTDAEDFSSECNDYKPHKIRPRSYSLNSKPHHKTQEDIPGVDIKPIVAIHEKWILEAKRKQNRSFSLPDNFRGLFAVKPASHLTDPARPKNGTKARVDIKSDARNEKSFHGCYSDIPSSVRSAITKKRVINASTMDFFENSLWRKEKEKCMKQIDPQNSSTPKNRPQTTFTDKSTNTQSIEELCHKIIGDFQKPKDAKCAVTDADIKNVKTSILTELAGVFEKLSFGENNFKRTNQNDNKRIVNTTAASVDENKSIDACDFAELSVSEKVKLFDVSPGREELFAYKSQNDIEDDCISLPENAWSSEHEDMANSSLKRCQAFSALQEARSTEDMYIDDELTANTDIHTLSDNMKLIPLPSNFHEATCSKGQECCLIQIQNENKCTRIHLFYENTDDKNGFKKDDMYFSDDDTDLIKLSPDTDESDTEYPAITNDLLSSHNKLSVIEEKSDEDVDTDEESTAPYIGSGRVVQDLISLYEGDKKNKSLLESCKQKEISVIMLDDDSNHELQKRCSVNMNNSRLLIEDTIHA